MKSFAHRMGAAVAFVATATAAYFNPVGAQGGAAGYIVTQRVTEGGSGTVITLRIKVAGGRGRVEMTGTEQGMPQDMYMVLRDDGRVTMVMPSQGMGMTVDAGQVSGGLQQIARAFGMEEPAVSGISVDVTDLGAGETILGFATRKYRIRQQYTITNSLRGQTRTERHDDVSELWMTTSMPGYADGLQKFAETIGRSFGGPGLGASEPLAAAMAGKMPPGYPLKVVSNSTIADAGGQSRTTTTTVEVTDVTRATFAPADFEVPPGIQIIDPAMMLRGRIGR